MSPDSTSAGVSIALAVRAGYFDEPHDLLGISHLVEHLICVRANQLVAKRGAPERCVISAATIYDHTSYAAEVDPRSLSLALEVLSEAFWTSGFDRGDLEREKRVVQREAARKADSSADAIIEQLYGDLYAYHPLGRWRIGSLDASLRYVSADVERFHSTHYRPEKTVISVAGRFDAASAFRTIKRLFGRQERFSDPPVHRARLIEDEPTRLCHPVYERRDIGLSRFAIGWRTPGVGRDDSPLFDLAAAIVEQDRDMRLAEHRRLGWKAEARHYLPGDVGVFVLRAEAVSEKLEEMLSIARKAVDRLVNRTPSATQVQRAKRAVAASWASEMARPTSRALCFAQWEMLSALPVALGTLRATMSASASNVRDVAARYLRPEQGATRAHVPTRPDAPGVIRAMRVPNRPVTTPADTFLREKSRRSRVNVEEANAGGVVLYRTAAGLPIIFSSSGGVDGPVSVGLYIRGGLAEEPPGLSGVTRGLARALSSSEWIHRRTRMSRRARALEFDPNPVVDLNYLGWSVTVAPHSVRDAIEVLSAFVQEAPVSAKALDAYQFRALRNVARSHEDATRSSIAAALTAAYGKHPYGLPDHGLSPDLARLNTATVTRWRDELLCDPRVAIVVVGPADASAIHKAHVGLPLAPLLRTPSPTVPSWPTGMNTVVTSREWRETGMCFLLPLGGLSTAEAPLHDLVGALAVGSESPLSNMLRYRRALCYVASGLIRIRHTSGVVGFCIETSAEHVGECRALVREEFNRLASGEIDEASVEAAKHYLSRRWRHSAALVDTRVHEILVDWYFHARIGSGRYLSGLRSLSSQSVSQALRGWKEGAPFAIGIAGRKSI